MSRDFRRDLLTVAITLIVVFFLGLGLIGASALQRTGSGLEGIATAIAQSGVPGGGAIVTVLAGAGISVDYGPNNQATVSIDPYNDLPVHTDGIDDSDRIIISDAGDVQDPNKPHYVTAHTLGAYINASAGTGDITNITADDDPNLLGITVTTPKNATDQRVIGIKRASATDSGAMIPAQFTKLAGIEDAAQVNPKHVVSFRTQDGSSDDYPGLMFFIKSDNSQWQSGSARSNLAAIGLHFKQDLLTGNPQTDTAEYQGFHSLLDDRAANGGSIIAMLYYMGSGLTVPTDPTLIVQSDNVVKNQDGTYALGELKTVKDFSINGTGYNWQVVISESAQIGSFADIIGDDKLPQNRIEDSGDLVKREDLEGHETDLFASYNNSLVQNTTYRAGDWVLTTDTSGSPTQANQVRQPDIITGSGMFVIGRLREDADPDNLEWAAVPAADDLENGDVWFASIDRDKSSHLKITLTSDGTLVGTGDAAYVWATASWVETGNIADVVDYGDYFRLGRETPSTLKVELPYTDILGGDGHWVKTDGSNVTQALQNAIQGDNEPVTLTNQFRVDVANVDYYVSLNEPGGAQLNTATIRLPSSAAGTDDDDDLKRLLQNGAWVNIGGYELDITTNATRALIGTSLTFTFNYVVVTGTKPTGSTPRAITVVGNDVHRGQIARQAFKDETPSIAGKGGEQGEVWTRGDAGTNGDWGPPSVVWLTSIAGTGNAITATAPELTALEAGQMVIFIAAATNTGPVTLNINSSNLVSPAPAVTTNAGAALSSNGGEIVGGTLYIAVYDGTAFRLMQ